MRGLSYMAKGNLRLKSYCLEDVDLTKTQPWKYFVHMQRGNPSRELRVDYANSNVLWLFDCNHLTPVIVLWQMQKFIRHCTSFCFAYVYKESFDPGWSKKQSHACNIVTRKDHQLIKFKLHLRENSPAGTLNSSVTPCLAHSVVKRETPEHWDGFRATFPFNSFPLIWPSLATYPSSITWNIAENGSIWIFLTDYSDHDDLSDLSLDSDWSGEATKSLGIHQVWPSVVDWNRETWSRPGQFFRI